MDPKNRLYLACKIVRDKEEGDLLLIQAKYARDVLDRFNMLDAKTVSTPCEPVMGFLSFS